MSPRSRADDRQVSAVQLTIANGASIGRVGIPGKRAHDAQEPQHAQVQPVTGWQPLEAKQQFRPGHHRYAQHGRRDFGQPGRDHR
jgi:hypothetical protein